MKIAKASGKHIAEITALVEKEFPYFRRTNKKLLEMLEERIIEFWAAVENEKLLGFIEIGFLEQGIARINGLSVKEKARGRGIGKKLLKFALQKMREKGIERMLLLVKQENTKAKELYKSFGFEFIGLYHRKLDKAVVEEMELGLNETRPLGVS